MADEPTPDEPFDPYAPPPPGQQPYGQPPPGQQPYGQPAGYGQYPHSYYQSYPPAEKKSSLPLWLGALAGLLLVGGALYAAVALPDLGPWLALGIVVAVIVLLVVPDTRRWGLGILIGAALSVPVGLIIFAGVCIVLITSYQGSS